MYCVSHRFWKAFILQNDDQLLYFADTNISDYLNLSRELIFAPFKGWNIPREGNNIFKIYYLLSYMALIRNMSLHSIISYWQ